MCRVSRRSLLVAREHCFHIYNPMVRTFGVDAQGGASAAGDGHARIGTNRFASQSGGCAQARGAHDSEGRCHARHGERKIRSRLVHKSVRRRDDGVEAHGGVARDVCHDTTVSTNQCVIISSTPDLQSAISIPRVASPSKRRVIVESASPSNAELLDPNRIAFKRQVSCFWHSLLSLHSSTTPGHLRPHVRPDDPPLPTCPPPPHAPAPASPPPSPPPLRYDLLLLPRACSSSPTRVVVS